MSKDIKEIIDENELDEVVGGITKPIYGLPKMTDLNAYASAFLARLAQEGYTAETLVEGLKKLTLAELIALAKAYIPEQLASINLSDKLAIAIKLAEELKQYLS